MLASASGGTGLTGLALFLFLGCPLSSLTPSLQDTEPRDSDHRLAKMGLPLDSSFLAQASLKLLATLPQTTESQQLPSFILLLLSSPLILHGLSHLSIMPSGC